LNIFIDYLNRRETRAERVSKLEMENDEGKIDEVKNKQENKKSFTPKN
jgi:hypothetical protein